MLPTLAIEVCVWLVAFLPTCIRDGALCKLLHSKLVITDTGACQVRIYSTKLQIVVLQLRQERV